MQRDVEGYVLHNIEGFEGTPLAVQHARGLENRYDGLRQMERATPPSPSAPRTHGPS